ncbi:MAG TPA: DUF4383 domain-containing protein [Blastocatellia bacterium]|nr:DUF4383 domain-containing protein [Blastocatellia bacterium]
MAKLVCKILGAGFILVGLIGFIAPNFLGMHLSPTHNVIHLLSGAAALYLGFAGTYSAARTFCSVFGAVYLMLGLLGFVAPGLVANLINAHHVSDTANGLTPDNLVHIVLGAVFLVGGLARQTMTNPLPNDTTIPHGR